MRNLIGLFLFLVVSLPAKASDFVTELVKDYRKADVVNDQSPRRFGLEIEFRLKEGTNSAEKLAKLLAEINGSELEDQFYGIDTSNISINDAICFTPSMVEEFAKNSKQTELAAHAMPTYRCYQKDAIKEGIEGLMYFALKDSFVLNGFYFHDNYRVSWNPLINLQLPFPKWLLTAAKTRFGSKIKKLTTENISQISNAITLKLKVTKNSDFRTLQKNLFCTVWKKEKVLHCGRNLYKVNTLDEKSLTQTLEKALGDAKVGKVANVYQKYEDFGETAFEILTVKDGIRLGIELITKPLQRSQYDIVEKLLDALIEAGAIGTESDIGAGVHVNIEVDKKNLRFIKPMLNTWKEEGAGVLEHFDIHPERKKMVTKPYKKKVMTEIAGFDFEEKTVEEFNKKLLAFTKKRFFWCAKGLFTKYQPINFAHAIKPDGRPAIEFRVFNADFSGSPEEIKARFKEYLDFSFAYTELAEKSI